MFGCRGRPSLGVVKKFMVERYLPGVTTGQLDESSARLAAAARELAADGVGVRYLGSTFVPEEESCFSRFEGGDGAAVRDVCERAGIAFARIVETQEVSLKEGQ